MKKEKKYSFWKNRFLYKILIHKRQKILQKKITFVIKNYTKFLDALFMIKKW